VKDHLICIFLCHGAKISVCTLLFSKSDDFYLSLFPLSATNPQFFKQDYYPSKGASVGRSLPASILKREILRVFRYNQGQGSSFISRF
jgi:hypothetical protein